MMSFIDILFNTLDMTRHDVPCLVSPLLCPEFIAVLTRNFKEKIHSSKFFHQSKFH